MHGYALQAFLKLRLPAFLHIDSQPDSICLAKSIKQRERFDVLVQHVRQDDTPISVEWRAAPFQYQGRTCTMAMLRDVSKRVQAESRLQQRTEVRANEQVILHEISQTLPS